ncbi:helix-turn-helix transcriptional regulator [Streptomyces cyaneofuscatus]|uniref:helix-turn-helix transcriptional regulator n=1 Tax=Streptomyces cyaneofuscatus TaxID=66883 RepID=UPI0036DC540A
MRDGAINAPDLEEWLTPQEVAQLSKLSVSTLKDRRWRGLGPDYRKLSPGRGGRIRYSRAAVLAWINGETATERRSA